MKKKLFIFSMSLVVILLALTIYYFKMHNSIYLPEELVVESFNSSGANFINSEMSYAASLDEEYQNEKYLNRLMVELAYRLGIDLSHENSGSNLDIAENDYMYKLGINGTTEHKENINIYVELLKPQEDLKIPGNTYIDSIDHNGNIEIDTEANVTGEEYRGGDIILSIKGSEPDGRLQDIGKIAEDVFKKYNIKPEFNCFIAGYFEGKLDHGRMNEVCKSVFHTVEAKKVEGIFKKDLISVSAYSPAISDYIEVNGNRVNIYIAFRYSTYDKKTYVWVGTPVIFN
jgi:hypothetical protein